MYFKIKVKQLVYSLLFKITLIFSLFNPKKQKRALIMAPSLEGSIGDEAVIDAITTTLKNKGFSTTLIHFGEGIEWSHLHNIDNWYSMPKYFKSGGWTDHAKLIFKLQNFSHFFALGTDMMDGCYADWLTNGLIRIANHAANARLKTTIVGFSLNSWQSKLVIENLGKMHKQVRYCTRDIITYNRFRELLPNRKAILTADMAFLLTPTLSQLHIIETSNWIMQRKTLGKNVIGININPQLFSDELKLQLLTDKLCEALLNISDSKKFSFLLIPHDFRAHNSDVELLKRVFFSLKEKIGDDIDIIDKLFHSSDIKGLVSVLDVVITARMHLSIACLGQGTPIGCIIYQGKFEGLFAHFEMKEEHLLTPENALMDNVLRDFILNTFNNRQLTKQIITRKIPEVKEKSMLNLGL